jgi:hypothetical protein
MSEISIIEYKEDIVSLTDMLCEQLLEDYDNETAFDYVIEWNYDADVAEWIIGDPDDVCGDSSELYHAVADAAKQLFKIKLLGVY